MTKLTLTSIILLSVSCHLYSQSKTGVYVHGNTGGQWVTNPEIPEDGTFAYGFGQGFGAGLFQTIPVNSYFELTYRLNYHQKSHKEIENNGLASFHYIGLDQLFKIKPLKRLNDLYVLGGLSTARMISNNLSEQLPNPHSNDLIDPNYYHRWSLGYIAGLGYDYDLLFFEMGFTSDLAPSYRTEETLLRNFGWFANIGINLY